MTNTSLTDLHIGVDLDHTTFEPLPEICKSVNDRYGCNLSPTEITDYRHPIPGSDDTIAVAIQDLHNNEDFIRGMPPMPGAVETLQSISEAGAELTIITHREEHTFDWTYDALDTHDIPYDNFVEDVPDNKADVPHDIDVLIDDLPDMVEGMASAGQAGILFLRPYNIDSIPSHDNVHLPALNGDSLEELLENRRQQWEHIHTLLTEELVSSR